MASKRKGNGSATRLHQMSADYGIRAATALNMLLPSQHRAKAIQRLFDVSERTAKYLLAGQHWTIDRLSQASAAIQGFDEFISTPNVHARIEAVEAQLAELQQHLKTREGGDAQ
jgi:alcohol dehydrogenase YqhD (iron-dependent ADH family)